MNKDYNRRRKSYYIDSEETKMTKKRLYAAGGWVREFGTNNARYIMVVFKARDNKRARKNALLKIGRKWYTEEYTIPQMDADDIREIEIFKYNQYEFKRNGKKEWFAKCNPKNIMRPIEKGL